MTDQRRAKTGRLSFQASRDKGIREKQKLVVWRKEVLQQKGSLWLTCFYCKVLQRVGSHFYSSKTKHHVLVGILCRRLSVCVRSSPRFWQTKKKFQHRSQDQRSPRREEKAKVSTKLFCIAKYIQNYLPSPAPRIFCVLLSTGTVDLETNFPGARGWHWSWSV